MKKIIKEEIEVIKNTINKEEFITKIINDILCNVVKFKSVIRKNRTFLRKKNSSKYSVGYKRILFSKFISK